jgi:hypothetical protein
MNGIIVYMSYLIMYAIWSWLMSYVILVLSKNMILIV